MLSFSLEDDDDDDDDDARRVEERARLLCRKNKEKERKKREKEGETRFKNWPERPVPERERFPSWRRFFFSFLSAIFFFLPERDELFFFSKESGLFFCGLLSVLSQLFSFIQSAMPEERYKNRFVSIKQKESKR